MFCVVQVLYLKKPNTSGDFRDYEVSSTTICNLDGSPAKTYYSYYPTSGSERFDRPHREAFRISIHESYREGGKVKKKQCAVGTVGYYQLVEWGLYDYIDAGINRAVEVFDADYDTLYDLVAAKMQPVIDRITREWHKSEEYKARRQREKVKKAYQRAKAAFGKKYDIDPREYDACYDIFGTLRDESYLKQIERQYEQKQEAYRSYQKTYRDNYNFGGGFGGSYGFPIASTYTPAETAILKNFYRTLSKTYHPDLNPGKDTTAEMQLLNKLKGEWGV